MNEKLETKTCAACGRDFAWRRKWASCWEQVRYCSDRCRSRRVRPVDRRLEDAILELLRNRRGTICPSEAARHVNPDHWRELMEATRSAGRRLADRGELVVLQRGRPVDAAGARGPIRYGRP